MIIKSLLSRLAIFMGGIFATISLIWNLYHRMDLLTAAFRFGIVFFSTVIILFLFLSLFSNILVRFIAEKVLAQRDQGNRTDTPTASRPTRPSPAGASTDGTAAAEPGIRP